MKNDSGSAVVNKYIASFPLHVRKKLRQLRSVAKLTAPNAKERLSYGMPALFQNGVLVWYAAHSKHIGFYPKASAVARFKRDLARFKSSKGSVQFPLEDPLPVRLIEKIVKYRVTENLKKDKKHAK